MIRVSDRGRVFAPAGDSHVKKHAERSHFRRDSASRTRSAPRARVVRL